MMGSEEREALHDYAFKLLGVMVKNHLQQMVLSCFF